MSDNEEVIQETNGDSFGKVKQRFKDRHQVTFYFFHLYLLLIWLIFFFFFSFRKLFKPRRLCRRKLFKRKRYCPNKLLRSLNKLRNMNDSSIRLSNKPVVIYLFIFYIFFKFSYVIWFCNLICFEWFTVGDSSNGCSWLRRVLFLAGSKWVIMCDRVNLISVLVCWFWCC